MSDLARAMGIRGRRYQDARLQAAYDGTVEAYLSGSAGWTTPGVHGLWTTTGERFRGAASHSAFWKGVDGWTLNRGRLMYTPGSVCRVAYMAGRDMRKQEEKRS